MKESVAVAKEADAKKGVSPTRSDKSIHRIRDEPERQLGSLRDVIVNIRRDGGKPSVENVATELSSMHSAERAPALLALQQTHGNRYVQRVVAGIQAKLVVGQPGDKYEQEADRVADAVMRMPEITAPYAGCSDEVRMQPKQLEHISCLPQIPGPHEEIEEEVEELVMARGVPDKAPEVSDELHARLNQTRGSGQPLPKETRTFMESRLGLDFSAVRVHTDSHAVQMARELNAEAFTVGRNIYFGIGRYNPGASSGKKLLAHELTHVVQQGMGITPIVQRSCSDHPDEDFYRDSPHYCRDDTFSPITHRGKTCYREIPATGGCPPGEHVCFDEEGNCEGSPDQASPAESRNPDGSCNWSIWCVLKHTGVDFVPDIW